MINAGAIMSCALLRQHLSPSARFKYLMQSLSDMAGGLKVGFSQETYLSEFATAYRNNAIVHYMKVIQFISSQEYQNISRF